MKNASQLLDELIPFLEGRRYTAFSEVEGLLRDIKTYLEADATEFVAGNPVLDGQLKLDLNPVVEGRALFEDYDNARAV